jgi:glycosyl transferase, family 25
VQNIPVYVVSLKRAARRRELISAHLNELGIKFQIVDAVEGAKLDVDYVKSINSQRPIPLGALGCYLSHIKLYEEIVANDIPLALILEDDAVLGADAVKIVMNGIDDVDFDYCFLSCEDYGFDGFIYYNESSRFNLANSNLVTYKLSSGPYCTNAYLVTLEGAKKRLACAFPVAAQIDIYSRLPYVPRFKAIIPMIAFLSEENSVESLTSANWATWKQQLRQYWWFYVIRDWLKLKTIRKWIARKSMVFPCEGRWRSFRTGARVPRGDETM